MYKKKNILIITAIIASIIFTAGVSFAGYYLIPARLKRLVETDEIINITVKTFTPNAVSGENQESVEYEERVLTLDENGKNSFIEDLESARYSRVLFIPKYITLNVIIIIYSDGGWMELKHESYAIYNSESELAKSARIKLDDTLDSYFETCRNEGTVSA